MTRLFLVRHGKVATEKTFYGHLDVALSATGVRQMEAVAHALARVPIAGVVSSDLMRAAEGARLIAAQHQLQVSFQPAFREMSLGLLEGVGWAEVQQLYPDLAQKRYPDMWSFRFPEGGESIQDVAVRVQPALDQLLHQHPDQTIVLVAHNSVNRVILGAALGLPGPQLFSFNQDFGCVNRIVYGETCRVEVLNWTPDAPG